jgi:tyrosine-protein phosphatase YwqE
MKNNRFSSESVVATMAAFVGICALIVSITQTHYQRKYLYASAWPHLQIEFSREVKSKDSTKNISAIELMNNGIGPAIVESVSYQYKGKNIESLEELIVTVVGKMYSGSYKSLTVDEVIASNEEIIHVSLIGARASRIFNKELPNIKMKIKYKSVHDEHWEYVVDSSLPNGSKTVKLD